MEYKVYKLEEISGLFPFGKTKLQQLLSAGVLPLVKIGRDYITNQESLDKWFRENIGREIFY